MCADTCSGSMSNLARANDSTAVVPLEIARAARNNIERRAIFLDITSLFEPANRTSHELLVD